MARCRTSGQTAAAVALAVLCLGRDARAFCRTTTCDTKDPAQDCTPDANGCVREGKILFWPERDIHFGVQKDGSPLRGITWEQANAVISQAFRVWRGAECADGRHPSFEVWDIGAPFGGITCDRPEFNDSEPNANVWMFRDEDWPYTGGNSTLALTTLTFEVPTGQILDADVEVNTFTIAIRISDEGAQNDLLSIATHEVGHFLGLSHSSEPRATMYEKYRAGDIEFRSLHRDDIEGICDIYPPDRELPDGNGPRPRHGFSRYCADPDAERSGCSVRGRSDAPRDAGSTGAASVLLVLAGLVAARARRRVEPSRGRCSSGQS